MHQGTERFVLRGLLALAILNSQSCTTHVLLVLGSYLFCLHKARFTMRNKRPCITQVTGCKSPAGVGHRLFFKLRTFRVCWRTEILTNTPRWFSIYVFVLKHNLIDNLTANFFKTVFFKRLFTSRSDSSVNDGLK